MKIETRPRKGTRPKRKEERRKTATPSASNRRKSVAQKHVDQPHKENVGSQKEKTHTKTADGGQTKTKVERGRALKEEKNSMTTVHRQLKNQKYIGPNEERKEIFEKQKTPPTPRKQITRNPVTSRKRPLAQSSRKS